MNTIRFTVSGKPRGKGRPRFTTRGGFPRAYTPASTAEYERWIRTAFVLARGNADIGAKHHSAVRVSILAEFKPPKRGGPAPSTDPVPYLHKPDVDNVAKVVLDALNGDAWADDAQVYRVDVAKFYGAEDKLTVEIYYS